MNYKTLSMSLTAAVFSAGAAISSPIYAISELEMSHSITINSGNAPDGIDIEIPAAALEISNGATSTVDDPTAFHTESSNVVIGNPFLTPVIPYQAERLDTTVLPSVAEGAQSSYDVSVSVADSGDSSEFDPINRGVEQSGRAVAQITSAPIAASAQSSYKFSREFTFENTTDHLISFNIAGLFEADLLAEYNGLDGFARTSGGFDLLFDGGDDVAISYFAIAPYLTTIEESGSGATVSEQLLINDGGITGVSFGASTSAFGDGGITTARYQGQNRYIFGISMEAGSFLTLSTVFRQNNSVGYTPQPEMPPVPLPASMLLMLSALGLGGLIRRGKA